MIIKNILGIFFESIYNQYNLLSNINKYNNNYIYISNQFQIIYNANTESKFDIQNKSSNKPNINNIIQNKNLDINYYSIIIMIITIFDILLILIKRILNVKRNKADKIRKTKKNNLMVNINFIVIFIIKSIIILGLINQNKVKI